MTYDFATRIKRIEAELMALKIAHGSGGQATVYDSEITLTQGGVTKGSFTVNQSSDETIALDAPNDGTLTIQKNGTDVQTFTANQSGNSTANITVPTTVAELSDASNYVQSSSLATVATTGDYDDLLDKPTIPTVSVSQTLTSGTEVGEITVNGTGTKLYAPTPAGAATSNYVWHGTCSTATATAAKVATLDDATGFTLADGVMVSITFDNSNTYSSSTGPGGTIRTLNVNSTGAKTILDYNDSDGSTAVGAAVWMSGETVQFTYDSTKDGWMRVGGAPAYVKGGGTMDFTIGNTLIQSGTESANSSPTTDVSVIFGTEFGSAPRVILTNNFNEGGGSLWWAFTKSISSTGFTFRSGYTNITGTGGGGNSGSSISWLAIGPIKGA